jgi:hypothetical protein
MTDEYMQAETTESPADEDARLDDIMEALDTATDRPRDDSGRFTARAAEESEAGEEAPEAEDAAPDEDRPSGEEEEQEVEPETDPLIDPPLSWTKEQREAWNALTPEARHVVLERETARDAEVRRGQNEVAEARKQFEAERTAAAQERQRYAEALQSGQMLAILNPVIAEGQNMDWSRLAQAERDGQIDPGTYNARWAEYQQAMSMLGHVQNELRQANEKQAEEGRHFRKKALTDAIPDLGNEQSAQAIKTEIAPVLLDVGFSQAEVDGFWAEHPDPRYVHVLREAAQARKYREARKTIAAKKATQNAPGVAKPRASDTAPKGTPKHIVALEKRARETGNIHDEVDLVLAHLMKG